MRLFCVLACVALAACRSLPTATELQATVAAVAPGSAGVVDDGRARFREIFCTLATQGSGGDSSSDCSEWLWPLQDEPPPAAGQVPIPSIRQDLRVFVVSGAFGDCRIEHMFPFESAIDGLVARGYRIEKVMVSGRSGAETNARQLATAIRAADVGPDEFIVLVGYSKGAVDSLQLLSDGVDASRQVVAMVSVAGPILGSPLAEKADWWYREVFAKSFGGFCDPGDAGVITSLLPEQRRRWLAEHPLPSNVHYYSLAAFTTGEYLSRALVPTWRMLAHYDTHNDGQVLARDAYVPGSTLLGYANADHWDVAIDIHQQLPWLSSRPSPREFPRAVLLEAILAYVSETLEPGAVATH